MYIVSDEYEASICGNQRHFDAKISDDDGELESTIMSYELRKRSGTDDLTVGSAFSASIEMSLIASKILRNREITLETGLDGMYIPEGHFVIIDEKTKSGIKSVTGYDKMYVNGTKSFALPLAKSPIKLVDIANLLAAQLDTDFDNSCITDLSDDISIDFSVLATDQDVSDSEEDTDTTQQLDANTLIEIGTVQETCGYIAGLIGRNAYIDRDGKLTFQAFSESGYIIDFGRTGDVDIDSTARTINYISCSTNDSTLATGSGTGYITMTNPLMTQDRLYDIASKLEGFTYFGATVPILLGDNRIDPWDIILYESDDGNAKILCSDITQTFDGGLQTDISSYALSESTEGSTKGPLQSALETLSKTSNKMIVSVDIVFAQSLSPTDPPTIGWQTVAPAWDDGVYMWQKTVTTYANGSIEETDPICLSGAVGQTGKGVTGINELYYSSESATELIGGEWSLESPAWQDGRYIWTKSVTYYTDMTSTETTPICTSGQKGQNGADGEDATLLRIDSSKGTVFKNSNVSTVLSVTIYKGKERITDIDKLHEVFGQNAYLEWSYQRLDEDRYGVMLATDSRLSKDGFELTITPDDVDVKVNFVCELHTD